MINLQIVDFSNHIYDDIMPIITILSQERMIVVLYVTVKV